MVTQLNIHKQELRVDIPSDPKSLAKCFWYGWVTTKTRGLSLSSLHPITRIFLPNLIMHHPQENNLHVHRRNIGIADSIERVGLIRLFINGFSNESFLFTSFSFAVVIANDVESRWMPCSIVPPSSSKGLFLKVLEPPLDLFVGHFNLGMLLWYF